MESESKTQKRLTKYSELIVFQELQSQDFDHPQEKKQYQEERRRMTVQNPTLFEHQETLTEKKPQGKTKKHSESMLSRFLSQKSTDDEDFWRDFKSFCQNLNFDPEYVDAILFATLFYFKIKKGRDHKSPR